MSHSSRTQIHDHAIKRLQERYGLAVTHAELDLICQRIVAGKIMPVARQGKLKADGSGGLSWYIVTEIKGKIVGLVFGSGRAAIIMACLRLPDGGFSTSAGGKPFYSKTTSRIADAGLV